MFNLWLSLTTAVGLSVSIGGSSGSTEHATGGVTFQMCAARALATFNAHEARGSHPAKGVFTYRDVTPNGTVRLFQVRVCSVVVNGTCATFAGQVVMSNVPGWRDRWVRVWVRDCGTPGRRGDLISFRFFSCLPEAACATPLTWFPVTGGNLVVHGN